MDFLVTMITHVPQARLPELMSTRIRKFAA